MAEDMNLQISIEGKNDTGSSFDSLDSAMEQLQKLAEDVSRSFSEFAQTISKSFSEISSEATATEKSLEEMMKPLFDTAVDSATNEMAKSIEKVGEAAKGATDEIKAMDDAGKKSSNPNGHGAKGGHGEGGLFSLNGQMSTMYAGMAMAGAAAPLDAGLGASIKAMADYDQAMRLVNEEMGLSNDKFGQLEQSVLSLSNATGISSQDLANGLYNVVATGVTNTSDALTLLKTSAEGAKAGNTDLNTSTAALNAVMGAYGMKASDAGHIMDVMFTAVNNGQMHFDALAKSVGASATTAATAGVSYTELAAAQATLTNVGKNAESASQNLNSLIMGMIAPTSGATKEAKALGIQWDAQALKAHGLSYMINEAIKATHGNSEELKKLVPNQRAYTAVLALGSNAHKQYVDTLTKMNSANGATEKALKQTEQGAGDSIEKMKSELTNAGIEIAMGLAPALKAAADKVQELAKWFSTLSPHTQKIIGEVALGAAVFLTLGSAFFMTISAIGGLVEGLGALKKAMTLTKVAEDGTKSLTMLGKSMSFLISPWGLVIAAVVIGAVLIITHWKQVKSFLESAWNAISNTAKSIWNAVSNFFKQWGTTLLAIFVPVIGLPILIAQHWNQIKTFASEIWNAVVNFIKNVWNGAINWIKGAAQDFVNLIVDAFSWMYDHNYYFKDLVDFIKNAWDTITKDAKSIWDGFTKILSDVWNTVKSVAEAFWNREVNGFRNIWDGIVSMARTVWNGLTSFFSSLWNGISSGVSSAWNGIRNTISSLVNLAIDALKGPFNSLGSFFSGLWSQAEQWGSGIINGVVKGIQSAASSVGSAISGAVSSAASFFGFHGIPGVSKHALGGIFNTPHLGLVAEAGPEAIIPLSNRSRGLALWQQAGEMLGGFSNAGQFAMPSSTMALPASSGGGIVYNITVNANGNVTRNERELGDIVSKAILNKVKMQGKI